MIEAVGNFHFIRPGWLLLAPAILFAWWAWYQSRDSLGGWRSQIEPHLLRAIIVPRQDTHRFPVFAPPLTWLIAVIAIAGPTWRVESNPLAEDSPPLMILMKADASTPAGDVPPSRLERAKLKIADLVLARQGQPIGLIAYAATAHLVLPPTADTEVVSTMASEISPDIMPVAGDRLDLAIELAAKTLAGRGNPSRFTGATLLVIADSIETSSTSLDQSVQNASFPIAVLATSPAESPEFDQVKTKSREVGATFEPLSADDRDIETLVRWADRAGSVASADRGEGSRWDEAGYALAPIIAVVFLVSFRSEYGDKGGDW